MSNFWLHRISHLAELSYPLLEKGILSIGFSDLTSTEIIKIAKEDDWKSFDQEFVNAWGTKPRTRHNLWRFLHFKKGDFVIVPSWGTFWFCEITSDSPFVIGDAYSDDLFTWNKKKVFQDGLFLKNENGNVFDLGFAHRVKIVHKNISRAKFADSKLTSRMKVRQTNVNISDLQKNIEKCIKNYEANRPIHLHSIIMEKTTETILESIKQEINPNKFEKLIKLYFLTIGADEVTIPAKNERDKEGDADIVAVFEKIKLIIYIQAKFQKGKIDEWGTNQVLDYKTDKETTADGYNRIAWVITTANAFNDEAQRIASENNIQLINGIEFSKLILDAGLSKLNTSL